MLHNHAVERCGRPYSRAREAATGTSEWGGGEQAGCARRCGPRGRTASQAGRGSRAVLGGRTGVASNGQMVERVGGAVGSGALGEGGSKGDGRMWPWTVSETRAVQSGALRPPVPSLLLGAAAHRHAHRGGADDLQQGVVRCGTMRVLYGRGVFASAGGPARLSRDRDRGLERQRRGARAGLPRQACVTSSSCCRARPRPGLSRR